MNAAPAVNATGEWNIIEDAGGQQFPISLEIKQDEADFSGSISSQVGNGAVENGKVSGKNLVATLKVEVQDKRSQPDFSA